jgi:hypothetical protein
MGGIDQSFLAQYYKEERIGMTYFSCRAYYYYLKKTMNYNQKIVAKSQKVK